MNALNFIRTQAQPERVKFTLADVDAMVERGVMAENAPVELIDGDLIVRASEGGLHANHKVELTRWFARALPDSLRVGPDMTVRLSETNAPEPDLYVFPADLHEEDVQGRDLLLVIEVAVASLSYDLRLKAQLYARFEVPEYWVVDVASRRVHVHTRPGLGGYDQLEVRTYKDVLTPLGMPQLSLRLADLGRLRT